MSTDDFRRPDGQECAVSLTYDDGLPVRSEHVGPALIEVARHVRNCDEPDQTA